MVEGLQNVTRHQDDLPEENNDFSNMSTVMCFSSEPRLPLETNLDILFLSSDKMELYRKFLKRLFTSALVN